jgi:hypothetical protein
MKYKVFSQTFLTSLTARRIPVAKKLKLVIVTVQ